MKPLMKLFIAKQMKELMKTKTIEKIRVTDICKAAEIERSTFYYHFQDKYELVAWIFYYDAWKTDVLDVKSATESMERIRKDYLFYKRAFEDNSQNPFWKYLVEYFTKRYELEAKKRLNTDILDTQLTFSIRLYCHGAVGITREWALYDNKTDALTIVKMMFQSMPKNMRDIFYSSIN
ncbi:MAG: TetR/AcrR family transcriptional regulator C-terminal domain-containing protein [Clostridium sp.]|nr:TetR/AcrR family transcriptional regulator C-terminal domain-containing protein [Clostridium sp.]